MKHITTTTTAAFRRGRCGHLGRCPLCHGTSAGRRRGGRGREGQNALRMKRHDGQKTPCEGDLAASHVYCLSCLSIIEVNTEESLFGILSANERKERKRCLPTTSLISVPRTNECTALTSAKEVVELARKVDADLRVSLGRTCGGLPSHAPHVNRDQR